MKCLRIFPEICASTLRWPGRSTRNIVPGNTCVTVPSATIGPSFGIAQNIFANAPLSTDGRSSARCSVRCLSGLTSTSRYDPCAEDSALYSPGLDCFKQSTAMGIPNELSILTRLFERKRRQIFAQLLPFPPRTGLTMFLSGREAVAIKHGANVTGGRIRKRIVRKKSFDIAFASQQRNHRAHKPRIIPRCPERGEPHLPIETRLMRCAPAGRAHHVARFPFELVWIETYSVRASFDHDLAAIFCHYAKESVAIHNPKRL